MVTTIDLFTDILSAVGLLSTGNRKHIIFCCCFMLYTTVLICIVVAILKMATGRNFSMSGINSGHHNLPTYEMSLKSDNVEFVRYCGGHSCYQWPVWETP
jgi:glycopeptide antibiotics resistance protein